MGLRRYQAKRRFERTGEPSGVGKKRTRRSAPLFVVQKHAASTLHYDFRLESDGVLKSWAIPKGPSLNPRDKRLAVQTEDHPLDYAGFEGTIPAGEYGGGTVIVWDRGTFEALGRMRRGLHNGKLSFELFGEKLHGKFSLVRLRGKGDQWLLIKARDEHSSDQELADISPRSVATGRTLEDVALGKRRPATREASKRARPTKARGKERAPARARNTGAREVSLSKLLALAEPELATLVKSPPVGEGWLHEMKFDGYRVLAAVSGESVRLLSRNRNDWTARFAAIAEELSQLPCSSAVIDGEVAVELSDGRTSFQALQRALREEKANPVYFVFDLLFLDGADLRNLPLVERKAALKKLLGKKSTRLRYSDHVQGSGADFFRHACRLRLEGALSKRSDSVYRAGRTKDWLKTKCSARQELVIGGYTFLRGDRKSGRIGALLLGVRDEDGLTYAGRVGTGFDDALRRELASKLAKLERKTSPFSGALGREAKGAHWARPSLVAEVEFTEWTRDGRLRHPTFLGLRDDKSAPEVVRERGHDTANARPVFTHPDRILFADAGVTKASLAAYYEAVASRILPELADRAVAFVRCPQGESEHCFFQRHPGKGTPATLRRVSITEGTGRNEYIVLDSLASLYAIVQLGMLELHTWGSRVDRIDVPDRLTFDLDPAEDVPWPKVVRAAKLVRDELVELGLASFVKTTGGKGLHVVVPLERSARWEACADFSKQLAAHLVSKHPNELVDDAAKSKRRHKIFVDYLRNARGATTIASYSPRARPHAPVAVPLSWDELGARTNPARFTVKSVLRRVRTKPDPWAGFEQERRPLPRKR